MGQEWKQELAQLEQQRDEIAERIRELRAKIAAEEATFKPGDIIEGTVRRVTRRIRVEKASLSMGEYEYRGVRILKDGSEGAPIRLYSWDAKLYRKVN